MTNYKRILVALDLSLMDRSIINYVSFLSKWIKPDKIYFIHAKDSPEIAGMMEGLDLDLILPNDNDLIQDLKEEVEQFFDISDEIDIEYTIKPNSPATEILDFASSKNIDLLVVGKKQELKGKGIAAQQIVRRIPCSVIFIPEKPKMRLNEIFVCNDFSNFAKLAMGEAIMLAQINADVTIFCEHVFHIPDKKYRPDMSTAAFKQLMIDHSTKKYNECISEIDTKDAHITPLFTPDNDWPLVQVIKDMAHRKHVDLIIIGSKGKSTESTIFIGTTAEKMTRIDFGCPLLIVKKKEDEFNFANIMKAGPDL